MCNRQELIVGYLYGEVTRDERRDIETHLAVCGDCRAELAGLQSTREHLVLWAPPEPDLGFRVIRGGAAPAPALPRRARLTQAFAFAAAAVIVLAGAAAIANIEIRYGSEGMTIRTGWAPRAAEPSAPLAAAESDGIQAAPARAVAAVPSSDFAALDRRLGELEAALARQAPARMQAAAANRSGDVEMLRRVRDIVKEAESRQQVAFAQQLLQVVQDFDRQRRTDLAMLQQGTAQYQGITNAEIAQTRDIVNQLMRVANKQEK